MDRYHDAKMCGYQEKWKIVKFFVLYLASKRNLTFRGALKDRTSNFDREEMLP